MRALFLSMLGIALLSSVNLSAQRLSRKDLVQRIELLTENMDSLEKLVNERVPLAKPVDATWEKWQDVRYNYGFNTAEQPIFNTVEGVLESTAMHSWALRQCL